MDFVWYKKQLEYRKKLGKMEGINYCQGIIVDYIDKIKDPESKQIIFKMFDDIQKEYTKIKKSIKED